MTFWQWLIPWEGSLTIDAAVVVAVVLYLRGCRIIDVSAWRKTCFWTGIVLAYAVLQTHFDYYAEHAFFTGQVQDAVLQHFSSFLIALSAPGAILLSGIPGFVMQNIRFPRFLRYPLTVIILFDGVILLWLIPDVHFLAMLDWRLYRLMNWSMFLSGLLLWSLSFNGQSGYTVGTRIAMMLAVIPAQIAAGALLFFAPREIYPIYNICGRAFGGITALQDQQLGGIILWLHGAMMSAIGILIVARREWAKSQTHNVA